MTFETSKSGQLAHKIEAQSLDDNSTVT